MKLMTSLIAAGLLLSGQAVSLAQDAATLPPDIVWETNNDDPPIGSDKAIRGGTFTMSMPSYPLTFRLYGPNSNDMFANWNRSFSTDFALVGRHPVTDRFIPILATHWSVQPDHKTIYYKLNPDVRWSDGQPVTADDYTFAFDFFRSPHIKAPFATQRMADYFESVEKIDTHTIKIVGKQESWRPLDDYGFTPVPRHATNLDENWVQATNYTPNVVVGPYVIGEFKTSEFVSFKRLPNWWGDNHRYLKGMYNPDVFRLPVILDQSRELDFFRRGELSVYQVASARVWETQMDFPELQRNWVHRKRVYTDTPEGLGGIIMNPNKFPLNNVKFRQALQYFFPFDELNQKLMFGAYFRKASFWTGTEYETPGITPYPFDPREGTRLLREAGFTKRGRDGILVDNAGRRAAFTLFYSSESFDPHMTLVKETYKRAGVDISLQRLEGGAMFEKALERAFEGLAVNMTAGYYPDPHQYFGSEFAKVTQNNNFWGYGNPEVDRLIHIYRFNMDKQARLDAMHQLDKFLKEESLIINFWSAPYVRFLYWHDVAWPETFLPRRASTIIDYQVFWIDPARKAALDEARAANRALPSDGPVEQDPWGVKAKFTQAQSQSAGQPQTAPEATN